MKCPYCNEEIDNNLNKCPICAEDLTGFVHKNPIKINKNLLKILKWICICTIILIIILLIFFYITVSQKENLYEVENSTYINSKGKKIYTLPNNFNIIGDYSEGHLIAGKFINFILANTEYGKELWILCELTIINNKGKIIDIPFYGVLPVSYNSDTQEYVIYIPKFYNGVAILINENGKTVAINSQGKLIRNKNIRKLQKRELTLKNEENYYLENKEGIIVKHLHAELHDIVGFQYSEGYLALAYPYILSNDEGVSDKLLFVNKKGNVVLKTKYHTTCHYFTDVPCNTEFSNGLALVRDDNWQYIYINKKGKPVITLPRIRCNPENFNGKLAQIVYYEYDKLVYIDKNGDEVYSMPDRYLKKKNAIFEINKNLYERYHNYPDSFNEITIDKNSDLVYENHWKIEGEWHCVN